MYYACKSLRQDNSDKGLKDLSSGRGNGAKNYVVEDGVRLAVPSTVAVAV